jgi:hypothetical protein
MPALSSALLAAFPAFQIPCGSPARASVQGQRRGQRPRCRPQQRRGGERVARGVSVAAGADALLASTRAVAVGLTDGPCRGLSRP